MRFMITGAGGQLSSEWTNYLELIGEEEVKAFDEFELDITSKEDLRNVIGGYDPDVIINCAAYTNVDKAEEEREKAFAVNSEAVSELATLCARQRIKLVHYSTDYVFPGNKKDAEKFPDGYPEEHQTQPVNTYGESKLKGEVAIRNSGCQFLIIRISWLCGSNGNNFVKTMLRLGKERKELSVVNDQWGCPTFTNDVVRCSLQLIRHEKAGVYHLSSKGKTNWYEFAKEIFRQKNMEIHVRAVPSSEFKTKAKRPAFSLLSTKKITNIPGITLPDWKDGLKKLLNEL